GAATADFCGAADTDGFSEEAISAVGSVRCCSIDVGWEVSEADRFPNIDQPAAAIATASAPTPLAIQRPLWRVAELVQDSSSRGLVSSVDGGSLTVGSCCSLWSVGPGAVNVCSGAAHACSRPVRLGRGGAPDALVAADTPFGRQDSSA